MKKNNKKGFFLSEVMVVIAVVAVVLMQVFVIFSGVYNNYKESEKYNTANAMSAAANIKAYFDSVTDLDTTVLTHETPYIDVTRSADYSSQFYTELKAEYNVNSVMIVNMNYMDESNLNKLYLSARKYLKSLKKVHGVILVTVMEGNEFGYTKIDSDDVEVKDCVYDGELVKGATYVYGQYTYKYMQQGLAADTWSDISGATGWGVVLTDKSSVSPAITPICSSINGVPIVSTQSMYYQSNASEIDVSTLNTSNVKGMWNMFYDTAASTIYGLDTLDTKNVTTMRSMFNRSKAKELDLSNFDTSNVTTMQYMFFKCEATSVDASSFVLKSGLVTTGMLQSSTIDRIYVKSGYEKAILDAITTNPSTLHVVIKIPSEYRNVEYLQSTGTQYIITNVVPTNTYGSYLKVSSQNITSDLVYAGVKGSGDTRFYSGANTSSKIYFGWNGYTATANRVDTIADQINVIKLNYLNDRTQKVNSTTVASDIATLTGTTYPISIFCNSNAGNYSAKSSIKLYQYTITNNDAVVNDFVPCYRKKDNVAGLYDATNNIFYTNSGTDSFTIGPKL